MAQLVVLLVTLLDSFNSVWTVILFVIQVSILRKYCANLNSWWTYASAFVWLLPLKCFNFPPERPVSHCCFSVRTVLRMFCTYSCLSPELRCRTTKHFELLDRSDWRYIEITLLTFLLEQLCHLWYPFGIIFMYCAFFSFCTLFILMLDAWRFKYIHSASMMSVFNLPTLPLSFCSVHLSWYAMYLKVLRQPEFLERAVAAQSSINTRLPRNQPSETSAAEIREAHHYLQREMGRR